MRKQEILAKTDIFRGLTEKELESVAELCEERDCQAGEVIFAEDTKGEELYIVKEGKIRIELALKGKAEPASVHVVTEAHSFGELCIVDKGRRSATATCISDCKLLVLNGHKLDNLFLKNTRIGYVFMKNVATILCNRLRRTNLQLVTSILWE